MTDREKMIKQVQMYHFAMVDASLFLDTHPDNQQALCEYHKVTKQLDELRQYYRENFGPLTPAEVNSTTDWTWVSGPWPWEN